MAAVILLLLIAVPIVEIMVLIDVGEGIGLWPTMAAVILTAMVGSALLRHQGLSVMERARQSLEQNRFPADEVFDGVCVLVAGAMLLIPGFITDVAGLMLFLPFLRTALKRIIGRRILASGQFSTPQTGPAGRGDLTANSGVIIEGEYHEVASEKTLPLDDKKIDDH
ncbi:MAG: FxsA family protein [Rhodospirillales bacterium]